MKEELYKFDTCSQMFDVCTLGHTAPIETIVQFLPHCDQHTANLHFVSLQRHPIVWNCWCKRVILLGDGGPLLNCRRNARWTETIDSYSTNHSTQNSCCSGVALSLCYVTGRDRRGEEHLLFRSMWETYFCVSFQNRNGRMKHFQSFWYTLYKHYVVKYTRFQASLTVQMRSVLFWNITQRCLIVTYLRFWTAYRFCLQG
jgi:hypothetical protein